jgi:hypothetical protein
MKAFNIKKWHALVIVMLIYGIAPFFSGAFGYWDIRGPKIYPKKYHVFLHHFGYAIFQGGKARAPYGIERTWFYGIDPE